MLNILLGFCDSRNNISEETMNILSDISKCIVLLVLSLLPSYPSYPFCSIPAYRENNSPQRLCKKNQTNTKTTNDAFVIM